jgi:hypothetical protein
MASEQWLLNQAFVSNNAYWNAVTGGSYKLQNTIGATANRVTSSPTPYEGAGCYASGTGNEDGMRFRSSASADLTGTSGTYYFDSYVYLPTGFTDLVAPILTGNDAAVEYTWVQPNADTSLSFGGYDNVNGIILANTTATGKFNTNAWFRVQAKTNQYGMNEFRVFVGGSIDGASPSTTVTPVDFGATYGHSTYQRLYGMVGNGSTYPIYLDNIKFDDAAYPTRSTAHTAAGTATATATGTAAMSNARTLQATATGTATGTAAASNQRTLAASASATASGTAAMSRTQVIGGSGTGTATGTANGSTTGIITFGGTGTGTATGTGGIEKVTNLYRSGEVYRNVSLYPASIDLVTAGGTATGTATGTGGVEKVTNPYRFGNVYRNAGTYPGGAALVGCDPSTIVAAGSAAMTKTRYLEATATATATSDAGMTHTFYIFKPPTREISPLSLDPYYQLVGYLQGRTLVKRDGVWKLVQNRQEDWLDQCEYVFKGGCENRINGTEKAELESAGYTVETRTS